ncbi:MAG: adenosylmethionine--8-amino-7-oxononanoate transaminase [Alphaproteobacteria bacterium]
MSPGDSGPAWLAEGLAHLWMPYTQMRTALPPLPVAGTAGTRIRLADGRELIDGLASWWTACHGYNHPHITDAIRRQAEAMPHVMFAGLAHEPAARLAARLAKLLPGELERVFFCDSGSVAVEVALKMAVQFWRNRGETGRVKFVAFRHGYHGDTMGGMAVSDTEDEDAMHVLFRGYMPEQIICDLPVGRAAEVAFDALLAGERGCVAAVIVEPLVQGAGGMKTHAPEVLRAVADICARHGTLLILDEVATGFGRTGAMFACEQAGVAPDIMCLSKALTGGTVGLGATVASRRVFEAFLGDDPQRALMHGPTFMANPIACAAANASLDLFEREPRLAQVAAIEAHLNAALEPARAMRGVKDVRAKGAIGVIQLEEMKGLSWLRERFVQEGLWLRPFADIVYCTPAFTIERADLARLTDGMVKIVGEWSRKFG